MTDRETKLVHRNILISLLVITSELSTNQDTVADLFFFLLRYPFLLNNKSNTQNSRVQKTPQLNVPQGNIYMGARYLDPKYSRWISVDPALAEYIPGAGKANARDAGGLPGMGGIFNSVNGNLYHYAGNNPVRYVDPDGKYLEVNDNNDGTYVITAGEANADKNIYIMKDGKCSGILGQMMTKHSFFDDGTLVTGSIIDTNDTSGVDFLKEFKEHTPGLAIYIYNARNGKKYDFKAIGQGKRTSNILNQYYHRGMQLGTSEEGQKIFGSARDVGNYAAGYVAGKYGLTWNESRFGFDLYQSYKSGKLCSEGPATQSAEFLGYVEGTSTDTAKMIHIYRLVSTALLLF